MQDASQIFREKLHFRTPEKKAEHKLRADQRQQLKYDALKLRAQLDNIYETFSPGRPSFRNPIRLKILGKSSWDCRKPYDVIWIGDVWDTGREMGAGHFKTIGEWRAQPPIRYSNRFTTGSDL